DNGANSLQHGVSLIQIRRDDTLACQFLLHIRLIQPAFGFRHNTSTLAHHIPAGQFLRNEMLPSCCLQVASGLCNLADKVEHNRLALNCFRCL
ncbi:MAG: hypothetical protein ACOYNF_18705, partial [Rhodoferax sp.]